MNCFENCLCSFLFYNVLLYPVCPLCPQTLQVKINRPGDGSPPLSTWLDLDRSKGMSLRQFSQKSLTEEKRFILSEGHTTPWAGIADWTQREKASRALCLHLSASWGGCSSESTSCSRQTFPLTVDCIPSNCDLRQTFLVMVLLPGILSQQERSN